MNWSESPFIVPLGAFAVAIVGIVAGSIGEANKQRIKAEQRMAMVARGMNAEDIDKLLGKATTDGRTVRDPMRSLANTRRTATVLISAGLGIAVFGLLLTWIVKEQQVLTVSAVGLIPVIVGLGFLVDYSMQKRDLARFGLEVERE